MLKAGAKGLPVPIIVRKSGSTVIEITVVTSHVLDTSTVLHPIFFFSKFVFHGKCFYTKGSGVQWKSFTGQAGHGKGVIRDQLL